MIIFFPRFQIPKFNYNGAASCLFGKAAPFCLHFVHKTFDFSLGFSHFLVICFQYPTVKGAFP